jgi:hypothetical protein
LGQSQKSDREIAAFFSRRRQKKKFSMGKFDSTGGVAGDSFLRGLSQAAQISARSVDD